MDVPSPLSARALTFEDASAVFALMAAQERHDVGEVVIEEADIVGDWQRPSFEVAASTVGVFDGDRLVAYGELTSPDSCDAAVHPDYRGRGLGTAIAGWLQDLARARGGELVGMSVLQGSDGDRLLASLGYFVRWESWILELPEGAEIVAQPLPAGHTVRTATGEDDHRAVWTLVEDAFLEWSERERRTFEDFAATTLRRPGFEDWNMRLVADADGTPVGACILQLAERTGFVSQLAVRRDRRRRGLARALLVDAFAQARAHGAVRSELSTDSRTGALDLYRRVGMVVRSTWLHRTARLRQE